MRNDKFYTKKYNKDQNHFLESIFVQSNGYLGIRGYHDEGIPSYEGIPANPSSEKISSNPEQFIAGYFDKSPVTGNSLVNIPTLKLIYIILDGDKLDLSIGRVSNYLRTLDMSCAVSERSFCWTSPSGKSTSISFNSFLSYPRKHIYSTRISIKPLNWSGKIEIIDTFDPAGLTQNQTHYKIISHGDVGNGHFCKILTNTSKLGAVMATSYDINSSLKPEFFKSELNGKKVIKKIKLAASKDKSCEIRRYLSVCTDFDNDAGNSDLSKRTFSQLFSAKKLGWKNLLSEQKKEWSCLWKNANVKIDGDPERNSKLKFYLFQLLQAYRQGDSRLNIGAKFLSGEHYSGHYFWDTENFVFPFYLATMPETAQNLVEYRVNALPGALRKAKKKKFKGAFYPWEASPIDDDENCPEWWHDKEMSEPVYIPCGNIEVHVNSAVANAAIQYMNVSGRKLPARIKICRMIVEIARFWASRGESGKGIYSIKNVIGPDEYHEYVDNNAYTNHSAKENILKALSIVSDRITAEKLGVTEKEIAFWKKIVYSIQLCYDKKRNILAQNDTFLSLTEIDFSKYDPSRPLFRQITPEELSKLQVAKQADVLALFSVYPFLYDYALMQRCWNYYEKRTIHDSNLSAGTHANVANLLGRKKDALKYFDKVLNLDIGNESYNVYEGIHAANAGNAWISVISGFAGIRWDTDRIYCSPQIPDKWNSLSFNIFYRGRKTGWKISGKCISITCSKGPAIEMVVEGKLVKIGTNPARISISRKPLGVVFDLDGVLVDSAICHYNAWKAIADELKIKFDDKKNDLLRGVSRRESMMIMIEGQIELTEKQIEHYMHKKNELYKELVDESGEKLLLPGVKSFLSRLKIAGIRLAVASSSKNTPSLLRQAGLHEFYFDAVADGNDIKNSKPHPEVFLLAAKKMGINPRNCIAVEDAPAGIEAGKRAGMMTFGIGHAELGKCDFLRESIEKTDPKIIFEYLSNLK
ncbi:MAG: beta-phosphoglucomutase [Lentisphaerae bacterium GWF2_49_21]|nr:MAG: beta-phosphoglucomutase [Lentisphaerae bacterium GWF2_49_21]